MCQNCSAVVFSNRAYNAIIRETFEKHPVETGGILLGHIVDDTWVVMEVLPPGINSIFQTAYFEYDKQFVNYLAQSVANQYKIPLSLLGLWHRHPGHMDVFSGTDDQTNSTFARQLPKGVISGLVNVDPTFRFTMYYLDKNQIIPNARPVYEKVDVEIGDDIIPPCYFELKYNTSDTDSIDLIPPTNNVQSRPATQQTIRQEYFNLDENDEDDENGIYQYRTRNLIAELMKRLFRWTLKHWKEMLIVLLVCALAFSFGNSIKSCVREASEKARGAVKDYEWKGLPIPAQEVADETPFQPNDSNKVEHNNIEPDGTQGNNDK